MPKKMNYIKIALISLFVLVAIVNILLIGKESKPITPGRATLGVILNALVIIGIIYS